MEQPLVKILFTGKIPNLLLARRLRHFSKNWEKLTPDQDILSVLKGYVIPFLKVLVQRTVPKQVRVFKTQELLIDQDIVEMLEKRAIENGISYPRPIPEQYSPGKKERWGKSS